MTFLHGDIEMIGSISIFDKVPFLLEDSTKGRNRVGISSNVKATV